MKPTRDRLAWLALRVLFEAAEQASKAPVPRSPALRLALAYLYSVSDGPIFALPDHRYAIDKFWCVVTGAEDTRNPQNDYGRGTHATSALTQVARQVHMPMPARADQEASSKCTATVADAGPERDEQSRLKRLLY